MATKKAAATPAPKSTALSRWDEKFAAKAVEAVAITGKGLHRMISVRGGVMSIDKIKVPGSTIKAVVLDHIFSRAFYGYDAVFDAENTLPPICSAFGTDEKTMGPKAEDVTEKQADLCAECKWSKFNTAKTGKGQACKDQRRLAIITEDSLDKPLTAEIAFLQVPPTSNTNYDTYVKQTANVFSRPPYAMVTKITAAPDADTQVAVTFEAIGKIEDSTHFAGDDTAFEELEKRVELTHEEIFFPYQKLSPEDVAKATTPAAAPRARGFTKAKK